MFFLNLKLVTFHKIQISSLCKLESSNVITHLAKYKVGDWKIMHLRLICCGKFEKQVNEKDHKLKNDFSTQVWEAGDWKNHTNKIGFVGCL